MAQTPTRTPLPQNGALAVRPLTVEVRSETSPDKAYHVTLPYCPCPDFHNRRGNLQDWACKHLRAALALVGAPPQDTTRLDEDTAVELLVDLRVMPQSAAAAVKRAVSHIQGTAELPGGGIAVIVYKRGLYDVELHRLRG